MSSHPHPHEEMVNEDVHHEGRDISLRAIVTFAVVLTVITVGIQGAMIGFFKLLNMIETKTQPMVSPLAPGAAQVSDFPPPSLQTTPWTDLERLRAAEHTLLNSYGWVDESAGIARIPIDRAKAMLLQKGLAVRTDAVTDASEGTHAAVTGEANSGRTLPAGRADSSPAAAAAPAAGAAPGPAPGTAKGPGGL